MSFVFSFFNEIRILFQFNTNGLDINSGNVFGHATLMNDILVLDLDDCYNNKRSSAFISYTDSFSDSLKWHARLGHIGQDRMNRLAKEGLLDRLTKVTFPRC